MDVVAGIAVSWAVDEWSDSSVELEVVCSGFRAPGETATAVPLMLTAVDEGSLPSDDLAESEGRLLVKDKVSEDCTVELPRQS